MKLEIKKIGLGTVVILLLFLASCASDDSDTATPTDDRDTYIGTWSCAETSSKSGNSTFDVTIRKDVNEDSQLFIDNFYLLGSSHAAVVKKSGSNLTLSTQSVSGNTIQGSGTIVSNTKWSLSYTVNDGSGASGIDNCTAILTKK